MEAIPLHTLRELGLTDKEAALYLASLSLGTASIAHLAKKADLKRPTTYLVVDALLQKGFLVAVPHGKKVSHKPENPSKLKEKVDAMRRAVETSLPILSTLFEKQHIQPKIVFYDTKEGVHRLYEEIFRSKEIWSIFSPDKFFEVFTQEDLYHYLRILDREGGSIYDILEDTRGSRSRATDPKYFALSQVRLLPKGKRIATDILVSGDKVAFVSFDSLIGVILEDRNIAATMRLMLQSLFEHCIPLER